MTRGGLALIVAAALKNLRIFLIALAVACAGLLAPIRVTVDAPFWERLMDCAHIPLFATLAVLLYHVLPARSRALRYAVAAIASVVFAGLIELIQPKFGRSGTLIDFRDGVF